MTLATFRRLRRDRGRKRGRRVRRAAMIGAGVVGVGALAGGAALIRKRARGRVVNPEVVPAGASIPTDDPWAGSYVSPKKGQYKSARSGGLAVRERASGLARSAGGRVRQAGKLARVEAQVRGREIVVSAKAAARQGGAMVRSGARSAARRGGALARRVYDTRLDIPPRIASAVSKGLERDRRAKAYLRKQAGKLGGYIRRTYTGYSRYPALRSSGSLAEFRRGRRARRQMKRRIRKGVSRARGIGGRIVNSDEVRIIGGSALRTGAYAGVLGGIVGGGVGALGGGVVGAAKAPRMKMSIGKGFRKGAMAGGLGGAAGMGLKSAKRGLVIGAVGGTGLYALKKLSDLKERQRAKEARRRR